MDVRLTMVVVAVLGTVCCLAIGGIVVASACGHTPDPALGYAVTVCLGAIVGLLVPVPRNLPLSDGDKPHTDARNPSRQP